MTRTIAVTTPTGNVGSKLIGHLFPASRPPDVQVVLLARKAEPVDQWRRLGARIHTGHLEDPDFVVSATRGVDALYWATPNSFSPGVTMRAGYRQFAESAAKAIRTNEIAHAVHLSGFAHVDDGGGERSLFGALADSEAILDAAVEDLQRRSPRDRCGITHLRAGFFFENLLGQLAYMKSYGRIFLPVDRGQRIPMVSSHDVARSAVECLLHPAPRGRVLRGVLGPEDLSFADVASSLTAGVGRTIRVHRVPRPVIRSVMLKIGRDPRTTDAFMNAFAAISRGKVTAEPPRDGASTTSMSLVQWARDVLKPLLEGNEGATCPTRVQYEAW